MITAAILNSVFILLWRGSGWRSQSYEWNFFRFKLGPSNIIKSGGLVNKCEDEHHKLRKWKSLPVSGFATDDVDCVKNYRTSPASVLKWKSIELGDTEAIILQCIQIRYLLFIYTSFNGSVDRVNVNCHHRMTCFLSFLQVRKHSLLPTCTLATKHVRT